MGVVVVTEDGGVEVDGEVVAVAVDIKVEEEEGAIVEGEEMIGMAGTGGELRVEVGGIIRPETQRHQELYLLKADISRKVCGI